MGRNQKRNKKAKLQTSSMNSTGQDEQWKNGEQWQWQEAISQDAAKFRRLLNFRNPAKFLWCSNSLVFSALLSFWSLICNADFESNSSCLDRLNNFGINSLQKL